MQRLRWNAYALTRNGLCHAVLCNNNDNNSTNIIRQMCTNMYIMFGQPNIPPPFHAAR